MAAIKLNEKDLDLLQKILEYGGYATSFSLCSYRNDISTVAVFYILKKLTDGGYLKAIPFYSDSRRNVSIYQVTAKTCKLFDNPDSYYRKKHEDTYIIRSLIKGHFLFEITKDFESAVVVEHEKKLQLLNGDMNFALELLPKKYNKGTPLIHVEEVILDLRQTQNHTLFCIESRKICTLPYNKGILIVHTDKSSANVTAQLLTLMERYKPLLELAQLPVDFLIVTDSKKREYSYQNAIDRVFYSTSQIQQELIRMHLKILQENLGLGPDEVRDLPQKIKDKYSVIKEITAYDLTDVPVKDIQENGMKAVKRLIEEALSLDVDNGDKLSRITALFRKLYRLTAAGGLKIVMPFTVHIYRIGYKYSVN